MAVIGGSDSLSTDVKFIYVPLNFSIKPKILSERIESVSRLSKFILIDIGQQALGLYEYGRLIHLFPTSSGKNGTPTKKFVMLSKEKDHFSRKYENAWMPYSMRLFGDYFLHAGILPSYAASHGCIRLNYVDAVFVFNWAEMGTPGEVVKKKSERKENMDLGNDEEESDLKALYN
jgi:lipoprotein-anchoring transpeptidase ErfK/SrfK